MTTAEHLSESPIDKNYRPKGSKQILSDYYVGRIQAWSVIVVGLLILVSPSLSQEIEMRTGIPTGRYLDELIFVAFLFVVVLGVLLTGRLFVSRVYPWLIAFSVFGAISTIIGDVSLIVAVLGYLLAVKALILVVAGQTVPLDGRSSQLLLRLINKLFVFVTLAAVGYAVLFEKILRANPLPGVNFSLSRFGQAPARSFFVHPSPFSGIMTLAALYFFSQMLFTRSKRSLFLFLLAFLGVFLSSRLKALLLLPLCLILIYVLVNVHGWRVKRATLIRGGLLAIVALIVTVAVVVLLRDLLASRIGNADVRSLLLQRAFTINAATYGLGAGFGMYGSAVSVNQHFSPLYDRYGISQYWGATANNPEFITDQWWAWYLGEVGLIGTFIFAVALVTILMGLYKIASYWRESNIAVATLAYAALAWVSFGIMSGYASVYLTSPPVGYFIMILAGVTYAIHRGIKEPGQVRGPLPSR